jgi:hypothetical protein
MDIRTANTTHLTDEQRIDWLRLIRSDNVGSRTFRSLINHSAAPARRWIVCPIWRGGAVPRGPAASAAKTTHARSLPRANDTASAWWRRAKPGTRRGWPCSTMRLPCSACAARLKR